MAQLNEEDDKQIYMERQGTAGRFVSSLTQPSNDYSMGIIAN